VIGLNILKANSIGQIPEPLKPVTMQLLSIRFTSSENPSGGTTRPSYLSSGIGSEEELNQFGIPVRVNLPGVGANLQDRYEVGVVSQMRKNFSLLQDGTFQEPESPDQPKDPYLQEWEQSKSGLYTSNGAVIGIVKIP